jgi:choline-sulfatase
LGPVSRPGSDTATSLPRPALGRALVTGLCAGAVAGAAAGVIDGVWSWSALAQFVPGAGGKLRVLAFLGASYALLFALAGSALAALVAYVDRATALGALWRAARERHAQVRERDAGAAVLGLSLVLAGVPALALTLGSAYLTVVMRLQDRKHFGLVIALAMLAALAALALSTLLAFALARPIERGLGRLARTRPRWGRVLSSPRAPLVVAAALVAAAGVYTVIRAWGTLSLIPLRWLWVALLGLALLAPAWRTGARLADRLASLRPALRRAAPLALLPALLLIMLAAGSPEGVRKAAGAYSGLGNAIGRAVRRAVDLDRDGYSPILGGGDCSDLDADVHPGADEIPDDGVDQNCVGGDPSTERSADAAGFVPVPASVPADFNVLLLTIDTVRADHLGAYGYGRPTSPNIDAVAADGALFVNGWAHAPSTRYSIPAILTGRLPLQVHYDTSVQGWPGLLDRNQTMAELMHGAGMATGAILNYWYFDRHRRMDQGFDSYDNENQRLHRPVAGKGPAETSGSSSRQQTDKALAFVAEHAERRFFLWVHYYDPHYLYEAHSEVPDLGPLAGATPDTGTGHTANKKIDLYDQEIRYTDLHIGRLLDDLRRRGLYERTVIVITGDHGEGFGEHGIDLHGYHLYAPQTKVPLIIRVPGLAPVRPTMPAAHVDLVPTLANLAGLPASAEMMGRSLLDVMSGQADPHAERYVFQQLSYENDNEKRAAASKQCHVIYNVSPETSWELYRIDVDPREERDVIDGLEDGHPCAGARAALEAWYDRAELPAGAVDALLPGPPEIAGPAPVHFGQSVELLAVELPAGAVRPGQSFPVTFTFAAHGALRGGWKIFAHFEGPGRFLGDHEPPRPFSWWRAGQHIRYTHTVTVPPGTPAGSYELRLGLFRGSERQPARSTAVPVHDDRARVGAIRVGQGQR